MTKQELKAKIDKLENGIKSKATPSNLIAPLKAQKAKFEKELEQMESAEKKAVKTKKVSKVAEKIKAAKTSVAKKTPAKAPAKEERKKDNIARDGDRKSLPSGKRISKSGKVYYETRANRSDKQTSKKPYLADGGMTDGMASVNEIARLTGLRPVAVAEWGDKNNINLSVVLKDLKSKKIKGMDLMTAVVGKPNNKYQKELLAKYSKNKMGDGGDTEDGVDLFEDYENIPTDVQKILDKHSDAFEDGDYRKLEKANNELKKIGYTFEYGLDGEAYDLRKIGQKGKMDEDEYADGGAIKGKNNETGETYGVVIGSIKKADDDLEGATKMNVRNSYNSRISEVELIFDKNGNLYQITDFGYGVEGNYPSTGTGSGRTYNADKKETLQILSSKYTPSFAKKLIGLAKGVMAKGGELKKAQLLIIDPSNPLSTQLKKITGDFLNSADFKDIGSGNFNILTHKHSNKVFIVYPKRIYDSLPEQEKQDDINYLKNVEKIKLNSDSMADGGETSGYSYGRLKGFESQDWEKMGREYAGSEWDNLSKNEKDGIISDLQKDWNKNTSFAHGGYVIFEGRDNYNDKPLYKVISKDEDNDYEGEFHDNREDAEKELNELKNKDMNYAKGGNTDKLYTKLVEEHSKGGYERMGVGFDRFLKMKMESASAKGNMDMYYKLMDVEQMYENDFYAKGGYMADGGEIYSLAENMTNAEYERKLSSLNEKQKKTYESLVRLGDSPKLALATTLLSNEAKWSDDTTRAYTMAKGGQLPAHFGSGKNIEVFGYETKNFDICGTAVKEFEAAVDIMKDSKELEKESLAYCAKYVDNLFGIEKVVVEGGIGGELNFSHAVSDIMSASTYNFRAGMAINLYSFVPQHLMEIALRLAKAEKGGFYALGGMTAGRWYKDASGEEFKFIGKVDSGANKGRFLFSDGQKSVYKDLEDFEGGKPKETKLFGFFAEGGEVGKSFTIKEMREKLDRMFPDSFKFNLTNFSKEGNVVLNSTALLQDMNTKYGGLEDKDLNSKLFFPQYKRDHDIKFRVAQGGENTYFYFVLEAEDGEQYIGNFGFKDRGDVSSDYITRFIALLMEQYGLPFEVKHSVMEKGGYMADGGSVAEGNYEMLMSNIKAIKHHAEELADAVKPDTEIEAWVLSKSERAETDLSDITHYLDGLKMAYGGYMAKGGDLNSIKEEYLKNEDENAHSENVVLLAKHFGTKEDLAKAKEILALHEKEGSLSSENGKKRQELHLKLIKKATKEMAKQGIEFEKGGYMADGGEVDKELIDSSAKTIYDRKGMMSLRNTFLQVAKADEDAGDKETAEYRRKVVAEYQAKQPRYMADGGKVSDIDMAEVESSARFYTDESRWSTKPTIGKFEAEIKEFEELKKKLDNKETTPSKIIGSGYKPSLARPLAYRWLKEQTLIAKRAIEMLKEKEKMAKGGIYSSDSLYILKVSKDGKEVGEERFRAKNEREAREMGEDYEEKYKSKFGGDLSFSVKEAESKMAKGGEFGFKPYGKTKGKFKITYMADGKKQSETWETKEMAINNAKRYASPKMNGEYTNIKVFDENGKSVEYMAMGGKVKFADKVKSVQESLLKRKKVAPQVQKDYGKTYSKAEAKESAQRIVGSRMAQLKEKMAKKKK